MPNREFIQAVIDAWQAGDIPLYRVGIDIVPEELQAEFRVRAATITIKAWLAQRNRIASDALWDGKPEAARRAMLRYGFCGRDARASRDKSMIRRSQERFAKHLSRAADVAELYTEGNRSAWGVVKANGKARGGYR